MSLSRPSVPANATGMARSGSTSETWCWRLTPSSRRQPAAMIAAGAKRRASRMGIACLEHAPFDTDDTERDDRQDREGDQEQEPPLSDMREPVGQRWVHKRDEKTRDEHAHAVHHDRHRNRQGDDRNS